MTLVEPFVYIWWPVLPRGTTRPHTVQVLLTLSASKLYASYMLSQFGKILQRCVARSTLQFTQFPQSATSQSQFIYIKISIVN